MSVFISIIIPLYNKERFIKNTLNSVFNQTFNDYEIILVDDSSTDDSLKVVNEVLEIHKIEVIILKNKINKGVSYSRNIGLDQATGDYVFFLDADDQFSEETTLEKLYSVIQSYQLNSLLLRRAYPNVKANSLMEKTQPYIKKVNEDLYKITDKDNFAAYGNFPFGGSGSMIISRDIATKFRFDESSQRFEDWSYFVPIYLKFNNYYYSHNCITIMFDENSLSNDASLKVNELPGLYHYLESNRYIRLRKLLFWKLFLGFISDKKGLKYNLKVIWKYKRLMIKNHQWSRFVLKKERSTILKIIKGFLRKKV